MPRSGGTYSLPAGSIVVNGTTIDASQHNTPLNDIASDLNAARPISSGGTGATTAAGALTNFGLTATAAELNVLDGISAIASQSEAEAGTSSTTLMTPERTEQHMLANALGWDQEWTDVTGSRDYSPSSYQNTTGRPISVSVRTGNNTSLVTAYSFQVSTDNSTWLTIVEGNTSADDNNGLRGAIIVPNNMYYRLVRSGANTAAITGWVELR